MLYTEHYVKHCQKKNINIDKNFIMWVNVIETIVKYKLGMDLLDLPDEDYMLNYENNIDARDMAKMILSQYDIILDKV